MECQERANELSQIVIRALGHSFFLHQTIKHRDVQLRRRLGSTEKIKSNDEILY